MYLLNTFQLPGIVLDIVVTYRWITYGSHSQGIYIQERQTASKQAFSIWHDMDNWKDGMDTQVGENVCS